MPDLDWWRADPTRWTGLAYLRDESEDGPGDHHADVRAEVLERLAADHRATDAEFLRFLLAEETRWHAASWGISESLRLAALLLHKCGQVEDVWAIWDAKNTNMDTSLGMNTSVLFIAGLAGTLEFIRNSAHPDRDELLEYLETETPPDEEWLRESLEFEHRYHRM
ncbi:hypothetical protein [Amycolatopsis samaneae]|uniref:Uncharacterized protein n=1 Tax=Amycolatopsis samaneae TaxID=664691 RepID=A0ABW5GEW2_9PSEU